MKSSQPVGYLAIAAALICFSVPAGQARAGIFTGVEIGNSSTGYSPYYHWSEENPYELTIDETWDSTTGSDYSFDIGGTTDGDPPLAITKNILNGTSTAWVGYNITLDPLDNDTFQGPYSSGGTSGGMTLGFDDAYNLNWVAPNVVLPGETVTFTFTVLVPDDAVFNFTLSQSPVLVPEPATLTLVGLAMIAFAACRRKLAR